MKEKRSLAKRILSLIMIFAVVFSYSGVVPVFGEEDGGEPPAQGDVGTKTDLMRSPRSGGTTFNADITQGPVTVTGSKVSYKETGGADKSNQDFNPATDTIVITGSSNANTITVDGASEVQITLQDVEIDVSNGENNCAFSVESNASVDLTLSGTNTLKSGKNRAGLEVPSGSSITIGGNESDSLAAYSNGYGAGIGGGGNSGSGKGATAGNITINSGTITAYSSETDTGYGAGIGGGGSRRGTAGEGGTIKITGGEVTAYSSTSTTNYNYGYGAGIGGGGSYSGNTGTGGDITIEGGTVIAYSSEGSEGIGAGIGGGGNNSGTKTAGEGGTIKITGGEVTAYSSKSSLGSGAGIGGGGNSSGTGGAGGTITIEDGTVTAYSSGSGSGYGAGIGGGGGGGAGGTITIIDGTVTAYSSGSGSGSGAGIGGGDGASGGTIEITGGVVTAYSSTSTTNYKDGYGAGIGGGSSGAGGEVTISGGTVIAYSSEKTTGYGAGIGGGGNNSGIAGVGGTITIKSGTVTAYSSGSGSGYGAGIGGGGSTIGTTGAGGTIKITGGEVTAYSSGSSTTQKDGYGAGIGGGGGSANNGGAGGEITIEGGTIIAYSSEKTTGYGAGIGGGCSSAGTAGAGGTITIKDGTVTAYASGSDGGYGAGIGGGGSSIETAGAGGTITIKDGTVTACSSGSNNSYGYGAGIGGGGSSTGTSGAGGTIEITGGKVTAYSGESCISHGAGIGGGGGSSTGTAGAGGAVTISGGTVNSFSSKTGTGNGAGIGGGRNVADPGSLKISGGSVQAKKTATGDVSVPDSVTSDGTTAVYLLTTTLAGISEVKAVSNAPVSGYGMNDVYTDTSGKVYLWLPANTYSNLSLTANSTDFVGDAVVAENNTNAVTLPNYTVTLTVNKDGSAYSSHGKTFYLYKDTTLNHTGTGIDGTITFSGVPADTYNIYEKQGSGTAVDTGVDFTVSGSSNTATLNYYTVTFGKTTDSYSADSTIAATYGGSSNSISSGDIVLGGKELVITAAGAGTGTTFAYAWSGAGTSGETTAALTKSSLGATINATCAISGYKAPDAPTDLTATAGNGQVDLSWTAPSSDGGSPITGYEYSMDSGATWVSTGSTNVTKTVTGLEKGETYTFVVRAVSAVGNGGLSNSVTVTISNDIPSEPTDLAVSDITETTAKLSWTAPSSSGSAPITDYEYSTDGGRTWVSTGSTDTFVNINGLKQNTEYEFKVRAINAGGTGSESIGVKATTKKEETGNNTGSGGGSGAPLSGTPVENTVKPTDENLVNLQDADKTLLDEIAEGKQPSIVLGKDKIGAEIDKEVLEAGNKAGFDYVDIKNEDTTLSVPTSIKDSLNDQTGDVLTAIIAPREKELPTATKDKLESVSKSNEELLKETFDIEVRTEKGKVETNEPLKVTVDISNMTEEEKNMLTGIVMEADGTYKQLGGEVSADGNSFTFYTYDQGTHGVVVTDSLTKLSLTIGSDDYLLNGNTVPNDVAPFISDEGRTMVPIRVVSEALGCEVGWDGLTQQVTITKDGNTITLTIGEELPNGMGKAVISEGRTFVPLRYVSEMLDANVVWDKDTKSVRVYS